MSDCAVTCYCGHSAPLEAFTERPVTGPLPAGHFQCPRCSRAWAIRRGKPTVYPNGWVRPGEQTLEPVAPRL